MTKAAHSKVIFGSSRALAFATALVGALTMIVTQSAKAQTFTVLHNFSGGVDGAFPVAGLTADGAGNLYGTTTGGSAYGTVFKMSRRGAGWTLSTLYTFLGDNDGASPTARVVFGPDGALYGTTEYGGGGPCRASNGILGCGTVFRLTPPATVCRSVSCPWTETVLYRFGHLVGDGINPFSSLAFDHGGNLYGTTNGGGAAQLGTVYELAHAVNGWNESILYSFNSIATGYGPEAEVTFDQAGNLYGTTPFGGQGCSGGGCGLVYKLSQSGSGWVETVLYQFSGGFDGSQPYGGLIFDTAGNIYGTTVYGGLHNPGGTVFELMPSNGGWNFSSIYSLYGNSGSVATLVLDGAGTLYGTAIGDPFGTGSIFQLLNSGGSWTFTTLHTFDGNDGVTPYGSVLVDSSGNLFGTASEGGTGACRFGCGVVWQITR